MTDRQLRHINAANSGDQAITLYNGIWGTDNPLMLRQTKLQQAIQKANQKVLAQKRNLGYRAETLHDLQTLEGRAWAIAKIAHEYAIDINDNVLAGKVNYEKSDFNHGSIMQIKTNAESVFNAVNGPVQVAMTTAGYHITALDVSNLGDIIDEVEDDMGKPKADIAATKAATEALRLVIKDELDPAMDSVVDYITPYALTNLDEYNATVDAFEISEIGVRHLNLRVRVSDSVTHTRYKNATVTVSGPELPEPLVKTTSKRGIADFSDEVLPEGTYTVKVELKDCTPQTFDDVAVFDAKMKLVDCQLVNTN
jgi:hypothetical protein